MSGSAGTIRSGEGLMHSFAWNKHRAFDHVRFDGGLLLLYRALLLLAALALSLCMITDSSSWLPNNNNCNHHHNNQTMSRSSTNNSGLHPLEETMIKWLSLSTNAPTLIGATSMTSTERHCTWLLLMATSRSFDCCSITKPRPMLPTRIT